MYGLHGTQSKIREYCLEDARNTVGDSKIQKNFTGEHSPDAPNVHVLFLQKMTMFLGPLTGRQINNFNFSTSIDLIHYQAFLAVLHLCKVFCA